MKVKFSKEFKSKYKKIKHSEIRKRITEKIKLLEAEPNIGKPLKNKLKNHRSLRIKPYRIIYKIENEKILILYFDHRKDAYDK